MTPTDHFWRLVRTYGEGVLMALLRSRSTGSLLVAATTHLWYHPNMPDIKLAQAEVGRQCAYGDASRRE